MSWKEERQEYPHYVIEQNNPTYATSLAFAVGEVAGAAYFKLADEGQKLEGTGTKVREGNVGYALCYQQLEDEGVIRAKAEVLYNEDRRS